LSLAGLQPGERLYDLGSGDGRVVCLAAEEFGAQAVGVEISPLHCLAAWLRAALQRSRQQLAGRPSSVGQIDLRCANFYRFDLSGADVVYAYMTAGSAERLRPRLEAQLKPGARVLAVSFPFQGWMPAAFDRPGLVFLYRMPPESGSLENFLFEEMV
jgi:cyclopropane fatty-acyl-phospholipid synthase-like methyltransferase